MLLSFIFLILLNLFSIDANVSKKNALDYLNKFGYVQEPKKIINGPLSIQDPKTTLRNSLKKFQSIHGLKVTGILDTATIKKIQSPRCIRPDFPITKKSEKKNSLKLLKLGNYVTTSKWKKNNLKYTVLNENKELGGRTRAIINRALKFWSDKSRLSFQEVHPNNEHDLAIMFGSKNHGDPFPFDGTGGVLAHAFFPEDGRVHFDEDENFTENTKNGINLETVAVHEFGHALGLDHSLVKGAVMNPYYQGYIENFKLGEDDVKAIQSLYGKPKKRNKKPQKKNKKKKGIKQKKKSNKRKSRRNKKPRRKNSKKNSSQKKNKTTKIVPQTTKANRNNFKPCISQVKSFFIDPESKTNYAILEENSIMYEFDLNDKAWKKITVKNLYSDLPQNARGGIADDNQTLWFFQKNQIFSFKNGKILKGFPKTINDFLYPMNPLAAVYKDKKIFIYKVGLIFDLNHFYIVVCNKNKLLYELNIEKLKIDKIHRPETVFEKFPLNLDAAFRHNGLHYFFNNQSYSIFDEKKNKFLDGYPRYLTEDWSLCKNA